MDRGVSGAKERRPALDDLLRDAKRRRFESSCAWRLGRLGRNLKHLIVLLEELQALGVALVSPAEGIDATTPAGRLRCRSPARSPSRAGTDPSPGTLEPLRGMEQSGASAPGNLQASTISGVVTLASPLLNIRRGCYAVRTLGYHT